MNGKRFLAIVLSLCMLYGEVGSCTQVITHSITAQAASTNADCYSFDEATGVLTLKGKIDGDILRESELQIYLAQNVKSVVAASGTVLPEDSSRLFYSYINCTSIDLSKADTSKVKDMNSMFYGCTNLTSLDISRFNTSNVTNMACMFCGCSSLTSLDVSGFDTSNVTNMICMFWGCSSLTTLDLSGFNTSKVTMIDSMFYCCTSLVKLDVSGFDTRNIQNMKSMFYGCYSLTKLDLSSFDTSNVTVMSGMFGYCGRIKTLALGKNFKNIATEASLPNGNGWVNVNDPKTVVSGNESYANIDNDGNNFYINLIACIKGDVNVDGVVNSDDIDILQKWLVHMVSDNEFDRENADINYDGLVNILDLIELSKVCNQNSEPESGSSDGSTSIEEEPFEQHIDARSEILSEINTDDNAFNVSLDITASNNALSSLSVDESDYSSVIKSDMESDMVVGVVPEFKCEEGAVIDNVTLNFNIKDGFTDNTNGKYSAVSDDFEGIKRFNVFKYFDDIGMLLPIETTYDTEKNIVTSQVDELGTYCLVDMEQWFENLGITPEEFATVNVSPSAVGMMGIPVSVAALTGSKNTVNTPIDVVFHPYADSSNDQNKVEDAIKDTAKRLFDEYGRNGNVRIFVANDKGVLGVTDERGKYAENEEELNTILNKINCVPKSNIELGIKYITNLNDLMTQYTKSMRDNADRYYVFVENFEINASLGKNAKNRIGTILNDNNITAVMLSSESYTEVLNIADGTCINKTTDFGDDVANFIIGKHGKNPNEFLTVLPNNWKKIKLSDPISNEYIVYCNKHNGDDSLFSFSKYPDTDGDGLIDLQEVDYRMLLEWDSDGYAILPTIPEIEKLCNIDLSNVKRSLIKYGVGDWNMLDKIRILPVTSDPTDIDTDKDGFTDDRDANPLIEAPNLNKYMEVKDFDYDFMDSYIGKYKEDNSKKANETYNSVDYELGKLIDLKNKHQAAVRFYVPPAQMSVAMSEAACALRWYLDNTGKDREISELGMMSFLLTNSGQFHFQQELANVSDLAKNVLKDGDTVILASGKKFKSFLKDDDDIKNPNPLYWVNDGNWFTTLGDAEGALIAKIKRVGNLYQMEYKYTIYDYYDWEVKNDWSFFDDIPILKLMSIMDSEFAEMHCAGIARSYFQYGQSTGELVFDKNSEPEPYFKNDI